MLWIRKFLRTFNIPICEKSWTDKHVWNMYSYYWSNYITQILLAVSHLRPSLWHIFELDFTIKNLTKMNFAIHFICPRNFNWYALQKSNSVFLLLTPLFLIYFFDTICCWNLHTIKIWKIQLLLCFCSLAYFYRRLFLFYLDL